MANSEGLPGYDQGFFNAACQLVREVVSRNYLFFLCEVDASGMDRLRARFRSGNPERPAPSYTAFVIKAAAQALRAHPHLNVMIRRRGFDTRPIRLDDVTATVAVERQVGGIDFVFAPAIVRPDRRSLTELTAELRHLATAEPSTLSAYARFMELVRWARYFPRATGLLLRLPGLSPALWRKFRGGSYVVTSPAKYGGLDAVLPPWPWPLTFAFGQVKPRPWVDGGRLVVRRTMRLTIAAERCLANGAPLARFSETLRGLLECPETLEQGPQAEERADLERAASARSQQRPGGAWPSRPPSAGGSETTPKDWGGGAGSVAPGPGP